jgi:hypothetical protein
MRKFLLVCLLLCVSFYTQARENPKAANRLSSNTLAFTENKGQVVDTRGNERPDILFTTEVNGTKLFFRNDAVSYVFSKVEVDPRTQTAEVKGLYRMDLEFVGANSNVKVISEAETGTLYNFYTTNRPVVGVRNYGRLVYKNLYNNIDLVFYATSNGGMKYDFVVRPGGNVNDIRLRHTAADRVALEKGALVATNAYGSLRDEAPFSFVQTPSGAQGRIVASQYLVKDGVITFQVGNVAKNEILVIDPLQVVANTYLGGTTLDRANGVARDAQGRVTVAGVTQSANFPATPGAHQSGINNVQATPVDGFIAQYNTSGQPTFVTFYGGESVDEITDVAVDNQGNIIVAGTSGSQTAIGTANSNAGASDAFVAKFSSTGTRQWGRFIGGPQVDLGTGVAVDASGDIYLSGVTYNASFPTAGSISNNTFGGSRDGFVAKFPASGDAPTWSRFVGSTGIDILWKIAVSNGVVAVAGETNSPSIPSITGSFAGGANDMLVATLNANTGNYNWGMIQGTAGSDIARSVTIDGSGNVILAGQSSGTDVNLSTSGAAQTTFGGVEDAVVAKISPSGSVVWVSYLGGNQIDRALDVATNAAGEIFVVGTTISPNFPVDNAGLQNSLGGNYDAFVARFSSNGSRTCDASYYGGNNLDQFDAITVDNSSIVVAGRSFSTNFLKNASVPAAQTSRAGNEDAVVVWLGYTGSCGPGTQPLSCSGTATGNCQITISPNGGTPPYTITVGSDTRTVNGSATFTVASAGNYSATVRDASNATCNTTSVSVSCTPNNDLTASAQGGIRTITVNISGGTGPYTIQIANRNQTTSNTSFTFTDVPPGTYSGTVTDANGQVRTITATVIDNATGDFVIREISGNPALLTICEEGTVSVVVASPAPGATYQWLYSSTASGPFTTTGATGSTFTINGARTTQTGFYKARNINNNQESNVLNITVYPLPNVSTTPSGNAVICSGAGFTALCGVAQENTLYKWFGVTLNNQRVEGPETASPCLNITQAGNYYMQARNIITGCVNISLPIAVTTAPGPAAPTVTAGGNTAICQGNTVTLTRSNEAGFTFTWTKDGQSLGVSGTSITVSEAGCYRVNAVAASGCQASSNEVCVTVNPAPVALVTASGGTEFCNESSITTTLTATPGGGNTYTWRRNGAPVSTSGSNIFRPTSAGTYDVIVTNLQGCGTVSNSVNVTVNALATPVISANGRTEYCIGENINLLVTATAGVNVTYQWFKDGNPFGSSSSINSIVVSQPGRYSVQTTSGVCSGTSNEIIVTQTPKPTATVTIAAPGDNTICEEGEIMLVANSGPDFMYQWYKNGMIMVGETGRTLVIDSDRDMAFIGRHNYTVSVGRFGCMSDQSNPMEIIVYPKPTGGLKTPNGATGICLGQSMILDAREDLSSPNANNPAELSYTWRFNGVVIPGANSSTYRAENPGTYQVRILNGKTGCERVRDITLTTQTPPVVTVFPTGNTTFCAGGEVMLTASPTGDGYRWFRNGVIIPGATGRTYTATTSGNYQAEVTVGACSAVSPSGVTVNAIEVPSAEITIDGETDFCSNANNTVLRTQPGADSYQWLMAPSANEMPMAIPGATSNTFQVTRQGLYWVIVTKDGCKDTTDTPIDISVRLAPRANIVANGNLVQCAGSRDLTLTALPPGANLTYQWFVGDNINVATPVAGATEAEFVPTFTGRFWVRITNARGCSTTSSSIDVKFKPIPTVRIMHTPDSIICQDGSVRMMAIASGAEPGDAYEYQWYKDGQPIPNTNSARFSATETGDYFVIVTAALCSSPRSNQIHAKVHPNPDITITLSGLEHPCDGVTLNAVELEDYSYQWLKNGIIIPGANNFSYTTREPGNYNVTIRNIITGCEETSLGLTVHPNPVADAGQSVEFCAGNSAMLMGSASGGNGEYNYMWTEPAGLSGTLSDPTSAMPMVTINQAGTYVYTLTVTDGRGCISAPPAFVTVTVNPLPVANAGVDMVVCADDAFMLMGSASGGAGGPYNFTWTGPNGFVFNGATTGQLSIGDAGTYIFNLVAVDGNGCMDMDQVSVEVKAEPRIIAVQYNNTLLFGADQLSPKSFCFGNKLVLESTVAGDFYEWFRDGVFVQGGIDNRYTVFIGGKYTIVIHHNTAGIRCTSQTSFDVTVFPEPVAQIFPMDNNVICPNGKTLTAANAPGYVFQWYVGNTPATATPIAGATSSTYTATTAGRYWVLVTTTEGGCQKLSDPVDLQLTTLNVSYNIGEPSRCGANDGSIQVTASSAVFPILYSINGGTERASGLFTNLGAGSYKIMTREVGGCVAETTIVLSVQKIDPTSISYSGITNSEATVMWPEIPNGTGTTRYNLRYKVEGADSWEKTIRNINGNLQDLVDLQHDTEYDVEIQVVCSDPMAMSEWSLGGFHTLANGTSCEMPSDIFVNIVSVPNMIPTVHWRQRTSNAACYDLQYRTVTPLGEWVMLQVNDAQNPFQLVGLQPATKYEVRMRTHCTFCNGTNRSEWSPNVPFVTPGECNPNFAVTINNGVNKVNNCGAYMLTYNGQVLPNYGFQWRVNGQEIGGANTNELLVTESGDYDLVLQIGNCDVLFSNAVEVIVKPIPEVIANKVQNVSCISGADGIITAGCVDTDRIICNESQTDFLYRLVGDNGYDSGFQPSGIFAGLRPGNYTAIILDQTTGCTDTYTDPEFTSITSPDKARFTGAVGQNQTEGRIRWTSVFGANAYILSYRPLGSTEQNWTDVLFDGGCPFPGECDYILGGLQNNTTYEIRVQTRCAQGNVLSDWTDTTRFFTAPLRGCPVAEESVPGGIYTVVTETMANVNWNAVTNGVAYQVRYRQVFQDEDQSIVLAQTPGRNQVISGLIPNTIYAYEVRTICGSNIAGEWSETRFFKTLFFRGEEAKVVANNEISVYPNPNNGQFTVSFNASENGTATIRMYDLAGKVVLNRSHNVTAGQGSVDIEMNGYASGIYMLHFTQGNVAKVVKVVIN